MLEITSFNPINWVNFLLDPLGLTISNREQVINKLARALFVMLAINHAFSGIEGISDLDWCIKRYRDDPDLYYRFLYDVWK
jgi:hypothetical protein